MLWGKGVWEFADPQNRADRPAAACFIDLAIQDILLPGRSASLEVCAGLQTEGENVVRNLRHWKRVL